ncbi:hypothetical protein [Kribbella deserti]|uniref:Uncharacterized protein n=1 Tax=Kribbella deserti TaxID=1926257 RepID=A0ABV6QPM9_9ACTN
MADTHNENEQDPGASTQMFRAFVDEGGTEPAAAAKSNTKTIAIVAAVVVVAIVVIALIVL